MRGGREVYVIASGLIAGRYLPTGEGYCFALRAELTVPDATRVVSGFTIAGPFLVVCVQIDMTTQQVSAEVTVVPVPVAAQRSPAQALEPYGDRFMPAKPGVLEIGSPVIGEAWGVAYRAVHWPWWVYEGGAGALALWFRIPAGFAAPQEAHAWVSAWRLREVA